MGCITSTPPKANHALKSQTAMMLNRCVTLDNELRIIIDDDKYKPIQNTIKRVNVNYVELSHSSTYSHSDTASAITTPTSCSREVSISSSSVDIIDTGGVTLMGFVQNETNDDTNNVEDSEHTQESEPSLIHTGCITLMGFADPNEVFIHSNHDLENKIVLSSNQNESKVNVTPN